MKPQTAASGRPLNFPHPIRAKARTPAKEKRALAERLNRATLPFPLSQTNPLVRLLRGATRPLAAQPAPVLSAVLVVHPFADRPHRTCCNDEGAAMSATMLMLNAAAEAPARERGQ